MMIAKRQFDVCDFFRNNFILLCVALTQVADVDARYCWHIFHGHSQYFYCSPNQSCCGTKCCDNIVAFYRLWYFWMCVLMLFVVCSGGGFWMRRRNHGDGLRDSLTSSEAGFVRRLQTPHQNSCSHRSPRQTGDSLSHPIINDDTTPSQHAQEPPPYSDVASSKPPSYDSLFRDAIQGGDNPVFRTEDMAGGVTNAENTEQPPEYKVT